MGTTVAEQPPLGVKKLISGRRNDLPSHTACKLIAEFEPDSMLDSSAFRSKAVSSTLGWARTAWAGLLGVGPGPLGCRAPGVWSYK